MDFTSKNNSKKKIIVVDFGSQVTKLIARRIRELGVFSEIYNINQINSEKNFDNIGGIILSGGPSTVTEKNFPKVSKKIFEKKIPILGICYGLQLIAKTFGGKVNSIQKKRESVLNDFLEKHYVIPEDSGQIVTEQAPKPTVRSCYYQLEISKQNYAKLFKENGQTYFQKKEQNI